MTRNEYIQALRMTADWLVTHAEVPAPNYLNILVAQCTKEDLGHAAKALGKAEKKITDNYFSIVGHVDEVRLEFYNSRDAICERVKVAEKVIPAHTLPALAEQHIEEKIEEVFEWKCPGSILAESKVA